MAWSPRCNGDKSWIVALPTSDKMHKMKRRTKHRPRAETTVFTAGSRRTRQPKDCSNPPQKPLVRKTMEHMLTPCKTKAAAVPNYIQMEFDYIQHQPQQVADSASLATRTIPTGPSEKQIQEVVQSRTAVLSVEWKAFRGQVPRSQTQVKESIAGRHQHQYIAGGRTAEACRREGGQGRASEMRTGGGSDQKRRGGQYEEAEGQKERHGSNGGGDTKLQPNANHQD